MVLSAVLILMEKSDNSWASAIKEMSNFNFLKNLQEVNKDQIVTNVFLKL
jgi:hypothetical protein